MFVVSNLKILILLGSPGMPNGRPQSQKSVHFADMPSDTSPPAYPQDPTAVSSSSTDVKPVFGQTQPSSSSTPPDCAFEADGSGGNSTSNSNGQPKSGKILPRFNHSSKSGAAPYTVPNQGMVMGPQGQGSSPSHGHPAPPPNYDFSNRSSCALSGNNNKTVGSGGRDSTSPGEAMQAEFGSRPSSQNNVSDGAFFMDSGSGIAKPEGGMAEFPPPPPPGALGPGQQGSGDCIQQPGRYAPGMEQYPSMQQHPQHQQHQMQQQQQQPATTFSRFCPFSSISSATATPTSTAPPATPTATTVLQLFPQWAASGVWCWHAPWPPPQPPPAEPTQLQHADCPQWVPAKSWRLPDATGHVHPSLWCPAWAESKNGWVGWTQLLVRTSHVFPGL